ncbi:fumarylacetoacetate hydrolase family protein [Streptomyces aurantiacus]|uniref:2-hydroxyhepta-2,4-diene-1,7-dioate isomerase n=1 Tax=Streptomyces aurantiacus TaxID=47760 RepID=A0A7G1P0X0_9ACTN|nr:fumarylacetoacetate hydrolase family protein [Streptomyces aurantiacus]BCL28632.1 2-hydroxyhepta-2,4-diene-1,7-dioate isomerase [Streptomyces aurantiacus]
MRLTTIGITRDRTAAARLDKQHLTLLPHPDVGALLASGMDWAQRAAAHTGDQLPLHAATTTAPLLTPGRLMQMGPNYRTCSKGLNQQHPPKPSLTIVRPHTTAGAQAIVPLPVSPDQGMVWGVELGVVVSRHAHRIPTATALGHVAGYVVVNHLRTTGSTVPVSESRSGPRTRPARSVLLIGPTLVTTDNVPLGGRGLTLTARLDGRLLQKANTSELHFDVATLVAHASTLTTLLPGDLITTGTPGGTLDHPLEPGQNLHVAIKGLGDITTGLTAAETEARR